MAEGYLVANIYSEQHMETLERKRELCAYIIDESMDYMQKPKYIPVLLKTKDNSDSMLSLGDVLQEFSRQLSVIAVRKLLT